MSGRAIVGSPLEKFSRTRKFTSGDRSHLLDVFTEQRSQFRQNQPCVVAAGDHRERADMPNFVFQTAGGHVRYFVPGKVLGRNTGRAGSGAVGTTTGEP
jgi:hypothetical protein